ATDRTGLVRANAALALGALSQNGGGDQAVKILHHLLVDDKDKAVRSAAARALGRLDGADPALKQAAARDPAGQAAGSAQAAIDAQGKPAPTRDDWLHIYAIDELGQPVRHELYVIIAPDGVTKAGYTDVRGEVSEEQVVKGQADFEFVTHEERNR